MKAEIVIQALRQHANERDAVIMGGYFKTGPGQYGEGDKFIGVRVPLTRQVCKLYKDLPPEEVQILLDSTIHEHRLAGAIILSNQYIKAGEGAKQHIYDLYLDNVHSGRINNWDIIDTTAEHVIGAHLVDRPRKVLFELAASESLWQRRVAIMSTFCFIKNGDASTTLELSEKLLQDKEDLMHKAVGWMLREVGKRVGEQSLISFLDQHAQYMPRTALRYAIEHLPPETRHHYMSMRLVG